MVWLLTPAPVVQRSSEISERGPSLQRPACLVLGVWWVWGVSQASLPFAHVPVQALGQALEPIVNQVVATDGGHRVAGCGDLDAAEDKWQRQGSGARKESAVDRDGRMVTSPQTGSPVSSCRQTTPRQCSWPRGTGWSNGDGRGGRSQSRPTDGMDVAMPTSQHAPSGFQILCTGDNISVGINTSREFWMDFRSLVVALWDHFLCQ